MSKVCSVCGTTNPESAEFCEGCGVELTSETTAPPEGETPVGEPVAAPTPEETSAEPAGDAPPSDGETSVDASPSQDSSPAESTEPAEESAVAASPAPEAGEAAPAKLFAKRHGALSDDAIPLSGARLVVGRFDPSTGPVDIDVTEMGGAEHISRRHAELYSESGVWKVRDLGSTNGVFLKRAGEESYGPRLQEPAELRDGDEIAFGNVVFAFRQDDL